MSKPARAKQETPDAQGAFEQAWTVPEQTRFAIEKEIANHNWKIIMIGEHQAESMAQNAGNLAEAFKGECFVFETKKAHDVFFEQAHPLFKAQISMGTLGFIDENTSHKKSDAILSLVDCVVCIGHVKSTILGEIKKSSKKIYTDPIDLDAIIDEKQRLARPTPTVKKQRMRVIGG